MEARDDVRSEEEHDEEGKRGGNDDGGVENMEASDGGVNSAVLTFATEEDADDPQTDISDADLGATSSEYFNATKENYVVEGSADASWKRTTSKRVQSSAARSQKQDDFVKNGARVKAILASALRAVVDGMSSYSVADSCGAAVVNVKVGADSERRIANNDDFPNQPKGREKMDYARLLSLANGKAEECMALKRVRILLTLFFAWYAIDHSTDIRLLDLILQKLQESQSLILILQSENSASQDANVHLKTKVDRTLEALQIAGTNAANARAEADASNARVESLTSQLNDLQSLIDDTKRCMEVVRKEHDEVSRSARSIEGQCIHMESELIRAAKVKKDAVEECVFLKRRVETSEKVAREVQDEVNDYRDNVRMLKKDLLEMEEMERLRSDRTRCIEIEVKDARASLLDATSAAAEAESTVTSLRSVVEELRSENERLHDQMTSSRDGHAKDRTKMNEALTVAEREAQKWKMKCEEGEDEIRKLTMDKTSAATELAALRSRAANMERRLNDSSKQYSQSEISSASSSVTPQTSNSLGFINSFSANLPVVSDESKKRKIVAELPMRKSSLNSTLGESSRQLTYTYTKERTNAPEPHQIGQSLYGAPTRKVGKTSNTCCLCSKEGGMMLRCQCGDIDCDIRGHAICIGKFRNDEKNNSGPTILCSRTRE